MIITNDFRCRFCNLTCSSFNELQEHERKCYTSLIKSEQEVRTELLVQRLEECKVSYENYLALRVQIELEFSDILSKEAIGLLQHEIPIGKILSIIRNKHLLQLHVPLESIRSKNKNNDIYNFLNKGKE